MNTFVGEFFGFVSGFCFAFAFLPQTIKTIKTKDVSGISLISYIIYNIGVISMIFYGIYLKSFQIVFFNTISEIFGAIILVIKILYTTKKIINLYLLQYYTTILI